MAVKESFRAAPTIEINDNNLSVDMKKLCNVHNPSGPIYQCDHKLQALHGMDFNELEAIYHLSESHSPGLRVRTAYLYERVTANTDENKHFSLNKQYVQFSCSNEGASENVVEMLRKIEEMPEEWTLIQLTSEPYTARYLQNIPLTVPIHISVFSCGKNQPKPFCITVNPPVDKIAGKVIGFKEEISAILLENKQSYENIQTEKGFFKSHADKMKYVDKRASLNNRLKLLINDLQGLWMKEWRCLFIGKYINENAIEEQLKLILRQIRGCMITEKVRYILKCLIKASKYLTCEEIVHALAYCFPKNEINWMTIAKSIKSICNAEDLQYEKRHPVILVIDEKLDVFPWEMLDILQEHPVSRMPSLHFTYGLFKEHEASIVNGIKTNIHLEKGQYIINPDHTLVGMQKRMHSFFKFWQPKWTGLVGETPSSKQFENMLIESDIFSYNGHGNGSQFISGEKIEKLRVNSVVLLFGCGSVSFVNQGPQVEMYGPFYTYLIACSPCVVGMLWEVTDRDTDTLATEFWSQWTSSSASFHWKDVNKADWEITGQIKPAEKKSRNTKPVVNEPELLRALSKAKKAPKQILTQASCVARGIPVKLKC